MTMKSLSRHEKKVKKKGIPLNYQKPVTRPTIHFLFKASLAHTQTIPDVTVSIIMLFESKHLAHSITSALLGISSPDPTKKKKRPPTHHVIPKAPIIHAPCVKNAQGIIV